jgi:glutamate decarboxylase
MIPSELERLILERKAKGHIPFFVNATAGTTVLGAFDPIEPIADICQKYKLWLHVDVSIHLLGTVFIFDSLQHTERFYNNFIHLQEF